MGAVQCIQYAPLGSPSFWPWEGPENLFLFLAFGRSPWYTSWYTCILVQNELPSLEKEDGALKDVSCYFCLAPIERSGCGW